MFYLPISIALFLLFLVLIPLLIVLAPALAFAKLGLPPVLGYAFFFLCLLGGGVNLVVSREKLQSPAPMDDVEYLLRGFFGLRLPRVTERVVAVNLGGAVLPGLLCVYLLRLAPLTDMLLATAITTAASYFLSRPVHGIGIVMPTFVPPVIAALAALLISRDNAPQVAYVSGVMGTLIGADLLRLPQIRNLGAAFLSIGGAGVFDGIFLVGIVSVLLA